MCNVWVCCQKKKSVEFLTLIRVGKFLHDFLGDLIGARINPPFGDS
jgi:hypothetical protein